MSDITEVEYDSLFEIQPLPYRSYEKDKITLFDMTIEMNHDLSIVQRNSYNFFDMLSDVGGVHTAIYAVLGATLAVFNYYASIVVNIIM